MDKPALGGPRHRVRLWFGEYQLADYIGESTYARRYEAAMRRRFPGLVVTNEPIRSAAVPAGADDGGSDGGLQPR